MLRSILEAQDQLERRYISKKEEHRALEMQNYRGLSRNTGTFDPNRHVEGDIFRIGMHLEDIKEMIDRNVCEQISPPCSSSTPTSVKDLLDMKPLCMSTPLPLKSLHEVITSIVASVFVNLCRLSLVCNVILSGLRPQAQILPCCIIKWRPGKKDRTRSQRMSTKMSHYRQAVKS